MRSTNTQVIRQLSSPIPKPLRGRQAARGIRQGFTAVRTTRPSDADPDQNRMTNLWSRRSGPRRRGCCLPGLGLSIAHIMRVLEGDARGLEAALATHQSTLECRVHQIGGAIEKVRELRADLALGKLLVADSLARLLKPPAELVVACNLPWPWGGERFEMCCMRPLNYIIGPLGSGKTRLARRLTETLPGAAFVGLERLADGGDEARGRLEANFALQSRGDRTVALLVDDGAAASQALVALLALIAHLRRRGSGGRPLFVLTRSSSILDLTSVGPDEAIILCPAFVSWQALIFARTCAADTYP
jgi:hypothetical protein